MPDEPTPPPTLAPLVIDLGKVKKRQIKRLERGQGRLAAEVQEAVEAARAGLGEEAVGKELVPVVVLYRKKRKKRRGWFSL
jgi:hypothetical protein